MNTPNCAQPLRRCLYCGRQFTPFNGNASFCSFGCYQMYARGDVHEDETPPFTATGEKPDVYGYASVERAKPTNQWQLAVYAIKWLSSLTRGVILRSSVPKSALISTSRNKTRSGLWHTTTHKTISLKWCSVEGSKPMRAFRDRIKVLKKITGVTHNRHHRIPKRLHGSDEEWNISVVRKKHHDAWNILFGELSPHQIADVISTTWIDPNLKFVCIPTNADVIVIQKHKAPK